MINFSESDEFDDYDDKMEKCSEDESVNEEESKAKFVQSLRAFVPVSWISDVELRSRMSSSQKLQPGIRKYEVND